MASKIDSTPLVHEVIWSAIEADDLAFSILDCKSKLQLRDSAGLHLLDVTGFAALERTRAIRGSGNLY